MHLMKACLLGCLMMIFRVRSTEPELPTLGRWASVEWIDEWYSKDATAAMLENPSLPADSSTAQATQKDQQVSWGDDPYRPCHIPGAVIPPSTHSPPPHPPHSQAPPGSEVPKAHSQINQGLATNTHTLVGDEPAIPWDLREIAYPLPKGSYSQESFEHPFSLWEGAQQLSVFPQFMPDGSHTSPASLPPNVLLFSDNPHLSTSKTAPRPWHQDAITLDNPYNIPTESSAAQDEHHNFRTNSYNYPTAHSTAKPMSPHLPHPHLLEAGPETQTAHPQNAGLGTRRSNPTGLLGHKPNPSNIQTITSQLTNEPNSQDSFEHLTSRLPSSSPMLMPHSNYANLASGFSHIPQVPKNSKQPSFKTTNHQSKQRAHQRITKLKPSTKPLKKQPQHAKNIWIKHSSGLSQTTNLISLPSVAEPMPADINDLTPHLGPLEFHIKLFEDDSAEDSFQRAERRIFQHEIDQLPSKLLIIQEEEFQMIYGKYISSEGFIQSNLTTKQATSLRQKIMIGKFREFQEDMKLWYLRWCMITLIDFEQDIPLPQTSSDKMDKIVEVTFSLYLFYVEMVCSIVPRDSTTSRDLKTELNLARGWFAILSTHPTKLLKTRLVKRPNEVWDRCILPLLWTYLGHWMHHERPWIFKMRSKSEDVSTGLKSFFNRAFSFSYSAIARKYICKKKN